MLVKDLLAEGTLHKTIDLLEGMLSATRPKKRRDDIKVRAYVVGAYFRKRPRILKLVPKSTQIKRARLKKVADKILKDAS